MIHGKQIRNASISLAKLLADANFSMDGYKITNLALPTSDTDAASKLYVDSVSQSLIIKDAVKVATTAASELQNQGGSAYVYDPNLSGSEGTDFWSNVVTPKDIDGVALSDGDRILIKDASDARGNGIWVYNDTDNKFYRSDDANNAQSSPGFNEVRIGMFCFVQAGTSNANNGYVLTATSGSPADPTGKYDLGSDTLNFTQFTGAGSIVAGEGLSKTGNTLDVNYDDSTIGLNANTLYVKDQGITATQLGSNAVTEIKINNGAVTVNKIGAGAVSYDKLNSNVVYAAGAISLYTGTPGTGLAVNVDGVTIEIDTNALKVVDGGIDTNQLADGAVTSDKIEDGTIVGTDIAGLTITGSNIANGTITIDKLDFSTFVAPGGGIIDQAGSPGGLAINVDDLTVEINGSNVLQVKALGIDTAQLANDAVEAAKIADGNVTLAKLNSGVVDSAGGILIGGSGLIINVDDSTIEIDTNVIRVKDGGITLAKLDIANILASITGNGLEVTGSPGSGIAVKAANDSVNVSSSGIKSAVLNEVYEAPTGSSAGGTDFDTGITLSDTPAGDSRVLVFVNGVKETVSYGAKTSHFWFEPAGGGSARAAADIVATDELHFNPTGAGYDLDTNDEIELVYSKIQ